MNLAMLVRAPRTIGFIESSLHSSIFKVLSLTALLLLAMGASAAPSPDGLWADASSARVAQLGQRSTAPASPRAFTLDLDGLKAQLASAPVERTEPRGVPVFLPVPDGSYEQFEAFAGQIMEDGLKNKMPEVNHYVIQGLDDPTASGRINITSLGLFAIVLRPDETIYVETWARGTIDTYVSYRSKDYFNETTAEPFQCGVGELTDHHASPVHRPGGAINRGGLTPGLYGSQLKTFRIAIASTTEFTAAQGGATNALAAITNTLAAINAIYERDLAVRFLLIANNNTIVYTGADPYTNGNLGAMLGENQANLDATIGSANYDIGHVFGSLANGASGLAGTGVCSPTGKAQGGSLLQTITAGQPLWVGLVAHEIGHQHSANHTFNGTTANCGGGNRNGPTAWEPASGTTLMSYSGICGAENIPDGGVDYFHTGSLEEMNNWIRVNPTGSSCGTETPTGNTPPASMGLGQTFTIPVSTPFELTGASNDANGDAVTHAWEQFDVGNPSPPSTDDGTRAIFRSFPPVASPTRNLPQTSDILANTATFGESFPTTNRTMNYRLTARDNRAGGGGVGWTTSQVTSTTAAGPFSVTSFNAAGGAVPSGGGTNITWNVANTNLAPVNCALVDITLSTDGGQTFPTTLIANTANDGSQSVVMPGITTTTARVKVKCSNNIFFDINNANFGIGAQTITTCANPNLFFNEFSNGNTSLNVATAGTIIDVDVSADVTVSPPYSLELSISHLGNTQNLQSPGMFGACFFPNIDVTYDDEAVAAPFSLCSGGGAGVSGSIQPTGMLSSFDGAELSGNWTLNYNQPSGGCSPTACSGTINEFCVLASVSLGGGGNNPPVLNPIGAQTVAEGAMLTIPLSATDPDAGDVLTLSQMNVPGFCNFTDSGGGNGSIVCNPMMGDANTYNITVTATDNGAPALQDDETFTLTVTGVVTNNPPVLNPIGPQTVAEGGMLTIPLNATDPDGNGITLTEANTPAFCNFTDSGGGMGSIVCNPGAGTANTYNITVTATDNGIPVMSDNETFALTVTPTGGTITQCAMPNLAIPLNEVDGTPPTISDIVIASADQIGDINVSLNAPHAWIGDLDVSLTHVDTATTVLVLDEPGNPALGPNGCDQDNINVVLDDEAAGGAAEDACSPTPPAMGGTLTPNNPLSAFDNEAAAGTWRLTITDVFPTADSGTLQEWCVTITPAAGPMNNPPVLAAIGPQTVEEGMMLTIPLSATDPDAGNLITLTQANLPGFCNFTDNGGGNGSIVCNPMMGDANTYNVTVTATDNGTPPLADNETFVLTVTPGGGGPIVQCSTPNLAIPDGNPATPAIDTLAIAGASGIADLNLSLTVPHTYVGDLSATLRHVDTGTMVVVLDRPGVPALGDFGCSEDNVDVVLDDEGASPAEDACSPTPPAIGGTLTASNVLSAFDGEAANGTWELSVSDSEGADTGTLQTWCVTIMPAAATNNPPVLAAIAPQTVTVGQMLVVPVMATDPDPGDVITLSVPPSRIPGFCTFTDQGGGMGNFTCEPFSGDEGTIALEVIATDNGVPPLQDQESFDLTVEPLGTDSDGDGVVDAADNCTLVSNADQRDTDGDGYGNICDPDFDNNGVVNFVDISQWPPFFNTACGDVDEDLNGDGFCNFGDYAILTSFFNQPPGPSGIAP